MSSDISRNNHQPEKDYSAVYLQQGRMLTDADWNELVDVIKSQVERAMADVVGGGVPRGGGLGLVPGEGAPKLVAGRVYTAGRWARLVAPGLDDDAFDYVAQVQLPEPPALPAAEDWDESLRFYVDVWDREVSALEDPRLRDVGLRGADTCTRTQRVAQVKWCPAQLDPEQDLPRRGDARLSVDSPAKGDEEFVPGSIGDFLFRLEVHRIVYDGDERVVTLKWSAENGAVVDRYVGFDAQWLDEKHVYEIFGEVEPLHLGAVVEGWPAEFPRRGSLHRHDSQLGWSPAAAVDPQSSFVRRWDGCCTIRGVDGVWSLDEEQLASDVGVPLTVDGGLISLDVSLHLKLVAFELALELGESTFLAGDHWLVAVRELEALEVDELVHGLLPDGVEHTYFDLGLVDAEGLPAVATDAERRRRAFPNLADLRSEDVGYAAGETTTWWEHDTDGSSPEHVHTALDMLVDRKVSVSGDLIQGDLEIEGDLTVDGACTFGSDVHIDGKLTVLEVMGRPPLGTIVAWHRDLDPDTYLPSLPAGWAMCNGQILDDPESPFHGVMLPDLNNDAGTGDGGVFLRGNMASGAPQAHQIQSHSHVDSGHGHPYRRATLIGGGDGLELTHNPGHPLSAGQVGHANLGDPTASSAGPPSHGSETRPVNMSVIWIIKISQGF